MKDADGNYVATRYMPLTGALIRGVGFTPEEARSILKSNVLKYREAIQEGIYFVPTGEWVLSPTTGFVKAENGSVHLEHDNDRRIEVVARPDLAEYIKGGRKGNYPKETRQIRRAHKRGE